MKRKMTMALAAMLVAGSLPVHTYAASNFKDINEQPWAASTILSVAEKGLISGYQDGTFRGKNDVTYSETMLMIYNVLSRTNSLKSVAPNSQVMYQSLLTSYKIPMWSQYSTSYGLAAGILTGADVAKFTTNGKGNAATRQDVVMMFGKALSEKYDIMAGNGVKYNDAYLISDAAMPYVDLMTRLGIVSGDTSNNFNPKANISRAEMAVLMNKTYDLLTNELADKGEITEIKNNEGSSYDVDVKMENGERKQLTLIDGKVKVYNKDGSKEFAVSALSKGDKVSLVFEGEIISKIYLLNEEASAQEKYDVTGYIVGFKDNYLNVESENTGETSKYELDNNCTFYLDGKKVTEKEAKKAIDDNSDQYAYVGLMTRAETKKVDGKYQDITYAKAVYITLQNEYTHTGEVSDFRDDAVSYKMSGSSANKVAKFASDCKFYIGDKKADASDLKKLADAGTTYIKITIDKDEKATKIIMSEDTFRDDAKASSTYKVKGLNKDRIILYLGGKTETHEFKSTSDVSFYTWDDKKFNDVKFKTAESYYDNANGTVYAKLGWNKGGKLTEIYLANTSSAWDEEEASERKGTVASIKNGKFKFETSSTEYTLLNKYNVKKDGETFNPLTIQGAPTSSINVLERMANCDDVKLYAEVKADADHKITEIEAKLTAAKGKLVEYDKGDKLLTLEASDGSQFKIQTVSNPKTDSDDYTAEDIATTGYIGSAIELEFNNTGEINKIIVTDSTYNSGVKRIKGDAESAKDGLKLSGSSKTYRMDSKTSVSSQSFTYSSIHTLKDMIEDGNIKIYIEASISDTDKVERINATVKEAEGEFVEYDNGMVSIRTKEGNTYAFYTVSKSKLADACGVDDVEELNDDLKGKKVSLSFDRDGIVEKIK